jgi:hypothetical protein
VQYWSFNFNFGMTRHRMDFIRIPGYMPCCPWSFIRRPSSQSTLRIVRMSDRLIVCRICLMAFRQLGIPQQALVQVLVDEQVEALQA